MESRRKVYYEYHLVSQITKDEFEKVVGEEGVISVILGEKTEIMIFFGREENGGNYEVRVYKEKVEDRFIPHCCDEFLTYKENDEYVSFFYDRFENAREFIEFLPHYHEEFRTRPSRIINE